MRSAEERKATGPDGDPGSTTPKLCDLEKVFSSTDLVPGKEVVWRPSAPCTASGAAEVLTYTTAWSMAVTTTMNTEGLVHYWASELLEREGTPTCETSQCPSKLKALLPLGTWVAFVVTRRLTEVSLPCGKAVLTVEPVRKPLGEASLEEPPSPPLAFKQPLHTEIDTHYSDIENDVIELGRWLGRQKLTNLSSPLEPE
ncbi:hypothetical protein STEG23_017666 [Scotinomys teguina]